MLHLQGKNTYAKVFTDNIDEQTIGQIIQMLNEDITKNTTVRIMPDTHYGKGCTIGTTFKLPNDKKEWKIAPQIVGVDLSCAMLSYKIKEKNIDLKKLDNIVNEVVPAGSNYHKHSQKPKEVTNLIKQLSFDIQSKEKHQLSLGTLGGGNHFIELAQDEDNNYWLTVHSGSRSLGAEIAKHHEKIAINYHIEKHLKSRNDFINELKRQNKHKDIQKELIKFDKETALQKKRLLNHIPNIPYLENELLDDYLNDIDIADKYAYLSRKTMLDNIIKKMGWDVEFEFDSVHNNIDIKNGIVRKGATSANKDELLLIPLNMRDGSLICRGLGNNDWNNSAPHGAGRMLSRKQAKELLNLDEYKEQMKNVYTSSINESTLDEAPDAYKPANEIKSLIGDTVEIIHHLKPVYNFKAH